VAIYIYTLVPEFLMRFLVWILVHSIYRLRVKGIENIPEQGPALLICNHVSFVDALIIAAACRRPIRFVMDHGIFKVPLLSFFFRSSKAIPIAPGREDPQVLERAYDAIAAALKQGELVGIFPEGKITYDGELNEFRGGMLRILERTPVPVVPMALQGLWGSFFSRKEGKAMSRWPKRGVLSQIGLAVGAAVAPAAVSVDKMQAEVLALRGAAR
jgi:1-acyl-sn-glycerol-3-phosphate acyltransferase